MPLGISAGAAILGSGAISGLSSIFGAETGADAATKAAKIQAAAANRSIDLQSQILQTVNSQLGVYRDRGQAAISQLGNLTGTATVDGAIPDGENPLSPGLLTTTPSTWGMKEFNPTPEDLAKTPGYQFALQQGLQATTNSYAPMGLAGTRTGGAAGPSGPMGAGLTSFATGLAQNTFSQQYAAWLQGQQLKMSQNQLTFNMLNTEAQGGQNAAVGGGGIGVQAGANIGSVIGSGGAAGASGAIGSANAIIGGAAGFGGAASNTALLYALNSGGLFGGAKPPSGGGLSPGGGGMYGDWSAAPIAQ